ncbi:MAG: CPBP family intramembrane metalloprotease [Burkholderiales bacterium]|nr:CPBP family intramembrane metalloprotease [Burkholderiales bacterium]
MLKLALLLLCLAVLWWSVRNDAAEYAAFKRLTDTRDRQRCYRNWIVKGFLAFSGTTLACLLVLQRVRAVAALPAEFYPLAWFLRSVLPAAEMPGKSFLAGFASAGVVTGILLGVVLAKKLKVKHKTLGDIEPLMPRNGAETGWTALLSINAGVSEELFFRLLLPLLLVSVLHHTVPAFVAATILFGLVHRYQGAVGVIATTVLGGAFAGLYLWTGSLWITMAAHAGLDLVGLVVRPTLTRLLHRPAA